MLDHAARDRSEHAPPIAGLGRVEGAHPRAQRLHPGTLGGDHALKAGFRYRTAKEHSELHVGGNTQAQFNSPAGQPLTVAFDATLYRDSITEYMLRTAAAYVQDTYTRNRLTLKLGLRWDRQWNEALPSSVPAHPFAPQWLPAVTFNGADGGVVADFSIAACTVADAPVSTSSLTLPHNAE